MRNSDKDNTNSAKLRLRHMFQATEGQDEGTHIPDSLEVDHLNKIVLKFENNSEHKYTLVDSVKQLLEVANNHPTSTVLEYLEKIKASLKQEIDQYNEVNIEEVISESESELRLRDQKEILQALIDDINLASNNQRVYDEERFAENLQQIVDEAKEEADDDEDFEIDTKYISPVQDEKSSKTSKVKVYAFFLFVIIGLIAIFYLYRDLILELFAKF